MEFGMDMDLLKFKKIEPLDKLDLFANYAYEQARFNGGVYDDKDIPMVPRYQANCGVNAGLFKKYHVSLIGKYVGERYAINDVNNQLSKVKHYYVLDGHIAYKKGGFELYTGIDNIFNEKYYDYVAKATGSSTKKDYYPAPERYYEVGVSYRF